MKKIALFLLMSVFFSFKNINCKKDFEVLDAKYYNWFGGVKDVKGKVFIITLNKKTSQNIVIKSFIINNQKFDTEQNIQNDTWQVTSRITEKRNDSTGIKNPIEKNIFFIEYYNTESKKTKKLKIKNFKYQLRIKNEEKNS